MSFLKDKLKDFSIRKYPALKLYSSANKDYFDKTGWSLSFKNRAPVDKNGNETPWLSYAAIRFLDDRITSSLNVFEFGAGNSTIYFSNKGLNVTSVEHDNTWYAQLEKHPKINTKDIHHFELESKDYVNFINQTENKFDLVIIDGRRRNECFNHSINALTDTGVILFDDFDRIKYRDIVLPLLEQTEFKILEFWGMSPGSTRLKSTAIFYRKSNVLDI